MKRAVTTFAIAGIILGLWAGIAGACHITTTCPTAGLHDNWNHDHITVRYQDGFQRVIETFSANTNVPNNGPHGHVTSAGFHNGQEWRYIGAPYGCGAPPATTTTVAPTTTSTTEAPTSTSTSTTTPTTGVSSTTTLAPSTTTTSAAVTSTSVVNATSTSVGKPSESTTSTTRIETGPPVSVMSPPAPPTDELPYTGSNRLVPVAAVGAVLLLAGLALVASRKKAQR